MAEADAEVNPGKGWRVKALEWIEAVAVAVFLAMVTRYFLVEPFTIPTGSMQPTLWGEMSAADPYTSIPSLQALYPERSAGGDKVLVSKCIYDFRKPQRWEIVVFRFPERERNSDTGEPMEELSVNYIKRLWGLPGETIQIIAGDVWIDGRIARKPVEVQEALWLRQFDEPVEKARLERQLGRTGHADAVDTALRGLIFRDWKEPDARYDEIALAKGKLLLKAAPPARPLELVYEPVVDYTRYRVGDLCLDFDFEAAGQGGTLVMELQRDGHRFRLAVPMDARPAVSLTENGQPVSLDTGSRLAAWELRPVNHVEFSNVDGAVRLFINGMRLFEHDYGLKAEERLPGEGTGRAAFGAAGTDLAVWNLRLRRDVYYTDPNRLSGRSGAQAGYGVGAPTRIPESRYFFLGDNSGISRDSRMWGTVPTNCLLGEAFFVFRPVQRWRFVN